MEKIPCILFLVEIQAIASGLSDAGDVAPAGSETTKVFSHIWITLRRATRQ
jgi:hypothetical protein